MARHIAKVRQRLAVAILALIAVAVPACTDNIVGPEVNNVPPKIRHFMGTETSLNVVGDDGFGYTLDVPNQTIERSDGTVLLLDADQTLIAREAFYTMLDQDSAAADLSTVTLCDETIKPIACATPDQNRVIPGGRFSLGIAETPVPTPAPGEFHSSRGTVLWRRVAAHGGKAKRPIVDGPPSFGSLNVPSSRKSLSSLMLAGPLLSLDGESSECDKIAQTAIEPVRNYKAKRHDFLTDAFNAADEIASHVFHLIPGSTAASYYVQNSLGLSNAGIGVSVYALYWNQYGCSHKHVYGGTVYQHSGGGGSMVCQDQRWEISFDGGGTWSPIWVTVCWLAMD
jgi:hypothetical protein